MVDLPKFTVSDLIEHGVHLGHKPSRWHPLMEPWIYGKLKKDTHIIDMNKTSVLLKSAMEFLYNAVSKKGRVLFVGTKMKASEIIAESAKCCGQYYVNNRWRGGMITNWGTVSSSIKKLIDCEEALQNNNLSKKDRKSLELCKLKLEKSLGGIRDMGGLPHALFIVDTNKEKIAIKEANKLKIPVVAILDTNSDPRGVDYPIPGNDDSARSIRFFCDIISKTLLMAINCDLVRSGINIDDIKDLSLLNREELIKKRVYNKVNKNLPKDVTRNKAEVKTESKVEIKSDSTN